MNKLAPSTWTKSSYSGQQANCLEWRQARLARQIDVRDSKTDVEAGHLTLPQGSWLAFVDSLAADRT
ncbi:DUF397 domain-containing protein [Yinghuangia sp. YIM S10712]|uniref:DUF397 domain-containing protein n=1 Tax=Yinghuangia sp. YIM S10712 TaxID=3436930 RepID=UPI003F52D9A6